ncbi:MAG: IMP dehydrogenase [Deltaproteobacteria bacterium]|nr:IMP dehydrogenase [Deltaproteobacteria bacterium]
MYDHPYPVALTFDDILLEPGYSKVHPKDVITKTRLTRTITLNIPVISAAMDTVTEYHTAVVMAQHGGLGVIHKNMSIDRHASEVHKVKRSEMGMVIDPICLTPEDTVGKALQIKQKRNISGFPVTQNNKLVGIVTNRDLRFVENKNLKIRDVMTRQNLVTVRESVTREEAKKLLQKHRIEKLLVVDKNKNLKGLITVRDLEKSTIYPLAAKDKWGRLIVAAATSVGPDGLKRAGALYEAGVDALVVDTAHGHSEMVLETVRTIRKKFKGLQIIAGNIATMQAAKALIRAGADAIKVGIGPGSICTTRIVSGVCVPQVHALRACVKAASKAGIPVISDGGIKYSGDMVKALAMGAQTVMIGSMFAGTDETPGETILYQGRSYKLYRGMGSLGAMRDGSKDRYFQEDVTETKKLVPEGIEGRVPYKGSLSDSLYQLIGGLKAGMGYVGAKTIKELQKKAKFVQITQAGVRESHVHDVYVTKESPNYRLNEHL